ncbi:MAG TPA: type III-B CRISPR module-associated protein Cmr5 [Salinisphaeraceae bacterium]|nr:type III-B CRISPR module-associated protein Cmr5 [Salinisphaeraceae bacterium]
MGKQQAMTLEQQRAAFAWRCARAQTAGNDYVNLAKGVPALIMNSGLIQVMAHLYAKGNKGNKQHGELEQHLRQWLASRFNDLPGNSFDAFAQALIEDTDPQRFQHITAEAMAWLRWLRQIAPAVEKNTASPSV